MVNKLYLIDGHSLIFRMYYAFLRRPMINSKGVDTSILFGFTKFLLEFIKREEPTHLSIAFDPPVKTFRHELYKEYKANRQATPELVKSSLEPLMEIVRAMNIPIIMENGYEADDMIGAMSKKAEKDGYTVYMISPDKDYAQLVSQNIFQCKPAKSGNSGELEVLGEKEICEQYNIKRPEQVIDILTLWGDSSDNIPGVRGIGEVGAKKLISTYGSVENIYNHLDELPAKQKEAFLEAESYISLSKKLVTIDTDINIDISEDDLRINVADCKELRELFDRYEFNSLLKFIPDYCGETITTEENKTPEYREVTSFEEFEKSARGANGFSFVLKYDSDDVRRGKISSITFGAESIVYRCDFQSLKREEREFKAIRSLFEDKSLIKVANNIKLSYNLLKIAGIGLSGEIGEPELMHYIINPERSHKFNSLVKSYLAMDIERQEASEEPKDLFSTLSEDNSDVEAKNEANVLPPLCRALEKDLKEKNEFELYSSLEMPLIKVLADMEYEGVRIDPKMLREYSAQLQRELDEIEKNIRESVNEPHLNISSPKQLGVVLYEKLNLNPKVKKNNKQNYPTDEETLNELADKHPIVNEILEYRGVKKLISTYVDPLPSLINPLSGNIHTTYNQSLTATGRLSSVKPNLQNIPIRTERGRVIRRAFIPSHDQGFIVSADYSQIELRLMAVMSGDPAMLEAFHQGKDIHTSTAARIFHIPEEMVTPDQRRKAKTANFGIIYGISAYGLSQRLRIPRSEAQEIISEYFKSFPKVREYMDNMIEKAKQTGYVETIRGRKRYLPDINSKNQTVKGIAERNAINAPIQGSAADIIKMAMINISNRLNREGISSKMVLQVHDELVFDVVPQEVDKIMKIAKEEMEGVISLSIPLTSDCNYGKNWLEAH